MLFLWPWLYVSPRPTLLLHHTHHLESILRIPIMASTYVILSKKLLSVLLKFKLFVELSFRPSVQRVVHPLHHDMNHISRCVAKISFTCLLRKYPEQLSSQSYKSYFSIHKNPSAEPFSTWNNSGMDLKLFILSMQSASSHWVLTDMSLWNAFTFGLPQGLLRLWNRGGTVAATLDDHIQ